MKSNKLCTRFVYIQNTDERNQNLKKWRQIFVSDFKS